MQPSTDDKKTALIDQGRLLRVADVMKMWPVSRTWLHRKTTAKDNDRIPSFKMNGKRLYRYDELMFYLENHRSTSDTFKDIDE